MKEILRNPSSPGQDARLGHHMTQVGIHATQICPESPEKQEDKGKVTMYPGMNWKQAGWGISYYTGGFATTQAVIQSQANRQERKKKVDVWFIGIRMLLRHLLPRWVPC